MTSSDVVRSQIRFARLAGFMFLFVIAAYMLGDQIISSLEGRGNFAEIAQRIAGSEPLYRIALSSQLVASVCTVFLGMGLYVVVKPIDNNLALLALVFRLAEATLSGIHLILGFVVLRLFAGADYLNAFDPDQLSALVKLQSVANSAGFNISTIFFSLGSTIFFYLFLKSAYIPRILSVLGLFASVLVTIVGFGLLISPQHANLLQLGWIPVFIAEISVGLWLLFKGVKVQP